MTSHTKLTLIVLAILGLATILTGFYGWQIEPPTTQPPRVGGTNDPIEALFRALLAFGGDQTYLSVENIRLKWARFLGVITTLGAVMVIGGLFLRDRITEFRARHLRGHTVLLGVSPFTLSYAQARAEAGGFALPRNDGVISPWVKLTAFWNKLIASPNALTVIAGQADLEAHRKSLSAPGLRLIEADMTNLHGVIPYLGKNPAKVILGERDEMTNINRARYLAEHRPRTALSVRIEDESLAKDLDVLSTLFANTDVLSEAHIVARSLVTHLAPTDLVQIRGHDQVHIALIGLGSTGLAIVEELALRCHVPGQGKPRITIFDKDADAAGLRLDRERPGLRAAAHIDGPFQLDGTACGRDEFGKVEKVAIEGLTAVVVCTGDDACNLSIGMRLGQLQRDQQSIRAPILLRIKASGTVAPQPVETLTSGISTFGGSKSSREDLALEDLRDQLGQNLHATWGAGLDAERRATDYVPWEKQTVSQRRTSLRAGLSAVEVLRGSDFAEPSPGDLAGLCAEAGAVEFLLADAAMLESLAVNEHDRWVAERQTEGWSQGPDNIRFNARKWHDAFKAFNDLKDSVKDFDRRNITAILDFVRRAPKAKASATKWRRRIRVGVLGVLNTAPTPRSQIEEGVAKLLAKDLLLPVESLQLEVLTCNRPGFDRLAAAALVGRWRQATGRNADLLRIEPAPTDILDRVFVPNNSSDLDKNELRTSYHQQSKQLAAANPGRTRSFTTAPPGSFPEALISPAYFSHLNPSDDPITGMARAFEAAVEAAAIRLSDLSDNLLVDQSAQSDKLVQRITTRRAERGQSIPHVTGDNR